MLQAMPFHPGWCVSSPTIDANLPLAKPVDAASVRNKTMKRTVFAVLVGTAALGAATIAAAQSTTPATTGSYSSMNVGAAPIHGLDGPAFSRSEEHTSELQSLMRLSYAVFCLKKKKKI